MKNRHTFYTIATLLVLACVTGVAMGVVSAMFLTSLRVVSYLQQQHFYLIFFIPFAGILTAYTYRHYGKGGERGNNLIIDSIHKETTVPLRMSVFTFAFTLITHLVGGSAGREGTAVQIGGTITNRLGSVFHLTHEEKRILIMAGVSAGFGSVFGTPFAGAVFGIEMPYVGKLNLKALLPCLVASLLGNSVTRFLGVTHEVHSILYIPSASIKLIGICLLAGVLFGIVARFFSVSISWLKNFYKQAFGHYLLRALFASLIVLFAIFAVGTTKYNGLSTWMISSGFNGSSHLFDPIEKFALTVLTLGAGFQGGEVTPLFDIGASLGGFIGQLFHSSPSLFAALGLIAVFGSAANTPATTVVLGLEMFGVHALPYYILIAVVSYFVTGHHGIYSAQVIVRPKGRKFGHHQGKTLEEIRTVSE